MRKLFLILIPLALGWAATPALAQREYVAVHETALTSAAEVDTVQAPAASGARVTRFVRVTLYCSVACDWTVERNGTAATSTALTPVALSSSMPQTALTLAFSASNVGVGTIIGKYSCTANMPTVVVPLDNVAFFGAGTTNNVTLRSTAITGTARVVIDFKEEL